MGYEVVRTNFRGVFDSSAVAIKFWASQKWLSYIDVFQELLVLLAALLEFNEMIFELFDFVFPYAFHFEGSFDGLN